MKKLLIVLSLLSCANNRINLNELYKSGKYIKIANSRGEVKSRKDSAIFIISSLRTNKYNPEYNIDLGKYYILNGEYNENEPKTDTVFLDSFPFDKFSSLELLEYANFYFYKKKASLNVFNKFLKESIIKDSTNTYALYDLARLALYSTEYSESEYLLNRLIQIDNDWPNAKDMLKYVESKFYPQYIKHRYTGIKELLRVSDYVSGRDQKFFVY